MVDARLFPGRHRVGVARFVVRRMAQECYDIADRGESDPHDHRVARTIDEFVDCAAIESSCCRPGDLDMSVIDEPPGQSSRRSARIGFALAYGKRCLRGMQISDRIYQCPYEAVLGYLLDV